MEHTLEQSAEEIVSRRQLGHMQYVIKMLQEMILDKRTHLIQLSIAKK
jgi:hypothetical protein